MLSDPSTPQSINNSPDLRARLAARRKRFALASCSGSVLSGDVDDLHTVLPKEENIPPVHIELQRVPRLVVADDDLLFRTSLIELLNCHGFASIDTCANGRDLLRRLMETDYDLVLLDLHMPDIDGLSVLEGMRSINMDIAVIVISGDSLIESAVGALRLGASDYVRKPYVPEVLMHTIESVLRHQSLERRQRSLIRNLERSERVHRFLVNTTPDLVFTLNPQYAVNFANQRAAVLLGRRMEQMLGESFLSIVFEDDVERVRYALERTAQGACSAELRLLRPGDDSVRHFEAQFIPVSLSSDFSLFGESQNSGVYVLARDISERKQANDRLAYLAHHDVLTGLPNRELFRDRLGLALIQARRSRLKVATMFIDLDRFKLINDTYGHHKGDELLKEVASRLLDGLREVDTLARIGGDEFTVLLPGLRSHDDVAFVARKLLDILARPFVIDDQSMFVSASIGIAVYPDDGEDFEVLMRHADIAMYHVKAHGKNDYSFFSSSDGEISSRRLSIENEIREAIDAKQFELYYQAQVDSETLNQVGLEALIRWHHPVKGLISAGSFIPVVEEIGLMPRLTQWVIEMACRDLRRWWNLGLDILRVSVNVSPCVLEMEGFTAILLSTLKQYDIPHSNFEIEITENIFIGDRQRSADCLREVSEQGIRIAIDDFGTQYSSLSYLRHLPITTLKIDQSFVREIESLDDRSPIVSAIIGLAQGLGLNVIAEGVETDIQAGFLRRIGCHEMQGFLFGRPVSASALERSLSGRSLFDDESEDAGDQERQQA